MPNRLRLTGFIFAVTFVVSVIGYTWDRWWYQIDEFQEGSWNVAVYKSTKGNILFFGTNDSLAYGHIFDPIQQRIGSAPYSKMFIFPYIAFNRETPLPVKWDDRNYNLVVEGSRIEFSAFSGFRIQVDISNY